MDLYESEIYPHNPTENPTVTLVVFFGTAFVFLIWYYTCLIRLEPEFVPRASFRH